ncbi:LysR substrate-binding domain-containing protein [Pseudomonas sp. CCI3.2]|uniref:LysR substrate-binding domain-containing protein n=1 Tax=unclassified Pseudomonas TaxID=196821 RepID=UPI002AC92EA0|nr:MULTISPECIES: LysR substrate-binding domain-containing protein [unclassified Pseudomonas]MEB0078449.1 LysR substrate-binding domain-containing protein [Pseudomonas sp. MH10out]MEB0102921.1 LysR substrate-binding domain-containing protein [Pseudomonas sp. CCI3.2]MEB0131768.1 LysR substrate-binding domain-containing protein [Pseudomonas sp. CCI2.4]MEB0158072.1 LysR substrate-binding domain-containing protein [Pseudomonas sp. AH2 (2023)]MEB0168085.1 LysR substrate-binding domain-containing pro
METLSGLEIFVETAQSQSFVATGRKIGISASAISKSISRLEERLGVRLFQRSTRTVRLTSEGAVFLERCRRILGEIQAAEDDISALTASPRGRLRVGLALVVGLPLPVISAFMEQYPEIQLDLDFTDRLVDVIDEGFDVVIRGSELQDSRLMSRPLGPYRSCLVASPAYLLKRGTPTKPTDLLNHACLHYRWQNSGKLYQWPFTKSQVIQSGQSLPVTMVCSNVEALIYLAQAGRGIACVPDFAVKESLDDGRLEKVLSASLVGGSTFHVVWPSSRQLAPKVRAFVDFVVEHFADGLVT